MFFKARITTESLLLFFFFFSVIAPNQNNGYSLPGRKAFLNSAIRLKAEKLEKVNRIF